MNEKLELAIITRKDVQYVSARELHEKLLLTERFNSWFERMLKYDFVEGRDFRCVKTFTQQNQYGGELEINDYSITIDMAKEICMLQRNEMGKKFRQYFIEVEKLWREKQTEQYKALRDKCKIIRNNFTDVLQEHGYTKSYEYINTTRNMKKPFGITSKKNDMTSKELKAISLSEDLARLLLDDEQGYNEVNPICISASETIAKAIRKKITA